MICSYNKNSKKFASFFRAIYTQIRIFLKFKSKQTNFKGNNFFTHYKTEKVSEMDALNARFAEELFVKVNQEWLSECVNFFMAQGSNISENELYERAISQLMLEDISIACMPSLTNEFRFQKNIWTLNKNLFLQMQYLIDICKLHLNM